MRCVFLLSHMNIFREMPIVSETISLSKSCDTGWVKCINSFHSFTIFICIHKFIYKRISADFLFISKKMSAASIITWTVPLLFAHFVCCHQRRHEDTSNLPTDPSKDKLIFVHTVSKSRNKLIDRKFIVFLLILFELHWLLEYLKICRHGDRNILLPYPNDPFKSEKLWPGGFGELTNVNWLFL